MKTTKKVKVRLTSEVSNYSIGAIKYLPGDTFEVPEDQVSPFMEIIEPAKEEPKHIDTPSTELPESQASGVPPSATETEVTITTEEPPPDEESKPTRRRRRKSS